MYEVPELQSGYLQIFEKCKIGLARSENCERRLLAFVIYIYHSFRPSVCLSVCMQPVTANGRIFIKFYT